MARGKENTFGNRCRYLCPKCWDGGNVSKTRRFPLLSSRQPSSWFGLQGGTKDEVCCCTFKDDGFLCLECKDRQNAEATSDSVLQCHGVGCNDAAGDGYERRRICTWCDKTLPRHLGGPARLEWNEKIIEARRRAALSRQADVEEYNRKRLKLSRMSRRELRGDEAVQGDPEADVPQYVRHLDTFNYRSFMSDSAAPTGNEVYLSKKGHWTYSTEFLKHIGIYCRRLPSRLELSSVTRHAAFAFARSNTERRLERRKYYEIRKKKPINIGGRLEYARLDQWHNLKAVILDLLVVQCVPFGQAQFSMFRDYDFMADEAEYQYILTQWGHDWRNVRFAGEVDALPEWEDVQNDAAYNESCEDSDLQLARKLQEQMDRDAAHAMQFEFFDEDDRARMRPNPIRGFGETIVQHRDRDVPLEDTRQDEEDEAGPASGGAATQTGESVRADDTTTDPSAPESDDKTLGTSIRANRDAIEPSRPKDDPPPYDLASPLLELARKVTWDEIAKQVREQMRVADPSLGRDVETRTKIMTRTTAAGRERARVKRRRCFRKRFSLLTLGTVMMRMNLTITMKIIMTTTTKMMSVMRTMRRRMHIRLMRTTTTPTMTLLLHLSNSTLVVIRGNGRRTNRS
jgi:hypothetical protein